LMFALACRALGQARLSAGTYGRSVASERDLVRKLFESVDLFFMNENEANLLFGSVKAARARPGQILFVTLGERGAWVIQGGHVTHVPGVPAVELDPTGAGDTFCGATLAGLARGEHPVMAASGAVTLAGEMIGQIGPTRLVSDRPATTAKDLSKVLQADDGTNPMPAFDQHLQAARAYGRDMQGCQWTPADVIRSAQHSERPRTALLDLLTHIGGYKQDPLRKKSMLLCLILEQRPERFLVPAPGEPEPPVIDYHLMRSCLRTVRRQSSLSASQKIVPAGDAHDILLMRCRPHLKVD